jgi:hypothetical protein
VVDVLQGLQVLAPDPRPIDVLGYPRKRGEPPLPKANPGVDSMPLLLTSTDGFATASERYAPFDPSKDRPGPITLGAAAMSLPETAGGSTLGKPLLLVFSSPYLADDPVIAADPTNLDLLMNGLNWLRGKGDPQGIAPKTHVTLLFAADPSLRLRLHLVPTLIAGLVLTALGVLTYLARRH